MRSVNICLVVLIVVVCLLINFWIILEFKFNNGTAKHSTKKHHHRIKDGSDKFPSEPVIPIIPDEVKPESKEETPSEQWNRQKELEILMEKEKQREREDKFERKRLEEHKKNHHHHRIHQHSHHGEHSNHSHQHTHIHSTTTERIETTTAQRGIVKEILEEINKNRNNYATHHPPTPLLPPTTTPLTTFSTTAHHIHHSKQQIEHSIQNHTHHGEKHKIKEHVQPVQRPQDDYYSKKHGDHHENNYHLKVHHHSTTRKPVEPNQLKTEAPKVFTEYGVRYPDRQLPEAPIHGNREDSHHRSTQNHYESTIAPTTTIIRTTMERIRVTPPPRRPFNPATFVPRIEVYRSNIAKNTDGALIYDITSTTTEKATTIIATTTMRPVEDRNEVSEWDYLDEPKQKLEEKIKAPEQPEPTRMTVVPIETSVSKQASLERSASLANESSRTSLTIDTSTSHYSISTSNVDVYEEETTTMERIDEEAERTQLPRIDDTTKKNEEDEITIVTAMIDIGRGDWWQYRRPLEKYHEFMENLLSLKNYMVIFTDISSYDFIKKYRKNMGLIDRTKVHLITIDDLPLSRHLPYAQKIIEDELKNDQLYQHDPSMKNHPEAKSAEYDIVVNSKTYFLHNATLEDPFNSEFFVWIDAGYGHGNASVFPYDAHWKPKFPKKKISMIKLTPPFDPIKGYKIDNLYRRNWSVVSGGFIAGDKRTLGQLYTIVSNKFIHLIYQNKVDDDQTVMVLAINSYPHLFNIQHGDWFDAFRLFSSDPERQFG